MMRGDSERTSPDLGGDFDFELGGGGTLEASNC